jgi:beta-phosphoglucomutase
MHLKKNGLKSVIFDLDGVVLDSMPSHVSAWQSTFSEIGVQVEPDFIYRNEGNLDWERLSRHEAFQGRGVTSDGFDKLLGRQRCIYLEKYADRVRPFPGAVDLLHELALAGVPLALVTSSSRAVFTVTLSDWLTDRFTCLVTRDMVSKGKPNPEPYLKALAELRLEPEEAVVVENAPAGIEAARGAGLTCLALTTTLTAADLDQADLVFSSHKELTGWFRQVRLLPEI